MAPGSFPHALLCVPFGLYQAIKKRLPRLGKALLATSGLRRFALARLSFPNRQLLLYTEEPNKNENANDAAWELARAQDSTLPGFSAIIPHTEAFVKPLLSSSYFPGSLAPAPTDP